MTIITLILGVLFLALGITTFSLQSWVIYVIFKEQHIFNKPQRIKNYLTTLTLELQTLARANGKSDVRNLEPEDLAALTVEAAAMARVPLAGTDWIPGKK